MKVNINLEAKDWLEALGISEERKDAICDELINNMNSLKVINPDIEVQEAYMKCLSQTAEFCETPEELIFITDELTTWANQAGEMEMYTKLTQSN